MELTVWCDLTLQEVQFTPDTIVPSSVRSLHRWQMQSKLQVCLMSARRYMVPNR